MREDLRKPWDDIIRHINNLPFKSVHNLFGAILEAMDDDIPREGVEFGPERYMEVEASR